MFFKDFIEAVGDDWFGSYLLDEFGLIGIYADRLIVEVGFDSNTNSIFSVFFFFSFLLFLHWEVLQMYNSFNLSES